MGARHDQRPKRSRRWSAGRALTVTVLTAQLLVAGPAQVGSAAGPGTLDGSHRTLSWDGTIGPAAAASEPELYASPATCAPAACQQFLLDIALPADIWTQAPGGVEVSVDWYPREENDLDLYVYAPDGTLAGRSDGVIASTGESVRLRAVPNGRYRVVVVARLVSEAMPYRGFVSLERDPAREPSRALLPNLVSFPPRHLQVRTGAYFADHKIEGTPSCYPEEVVEQGARRCLRFDQVIGNAGDGPFELRYRMEGLGSDQQLRQRVYASDGSHTEFVVDTYEFHPAHAHFHYKNFGQAFLYQVNPDGSLTRVRESRKNGFCMIDVENTRFGPSADGARSGRFPRTYYFPRCNAPTERDAGGTYMVNGISAGWADVYNWFLADQYIEISGVADGRYVLETVANPAHTVHETSVDDNTARVEFRLRGDTIDVMAIEPSAGRAAAGPG